MNLTERVKQLAFDQQMDYVRIAPVERFSQAPEGHKPTDLLHGARSVISIGMKLAEGIRRANVLAHDTGLRHALYPYMWYGYGQINLHFLDRTALLITRLLEREGYVSLPMVSSAVEDSRTQMGALSNRHAAVAAGTGVFGWNTLCLTGESGPRQRFGSIITKAPLEADPMYEGPRVCDLNVCKSLCKEKYGVEKPICVHICPVKALSEDKSVSLVIGDKQFSYARLDKRKCIWAAVGLHKDAGAMKHVPMPETVDSEAIAWGRSQIPQAQLNEWAVIGRSHYCGKCITYCPVGGLEERD